MHEIRDILSLKEAAQMLGRSTATMRWAAETGRLPAKRLGRDWATTRDAVVWYSLSHKRDMNRDYRPTRRQLVLREQLSLRPGSR